MPITRVTEASMSQITLAGLQIPLAARIVSVADVYNALRSRRVFRRALTPVEALRVMTEESAHQFVGPFSRGDVEHASHHA